MNKKICYGLLAAGLYLALPVTPAFALGTSPMSSAALERGVTAAPVLADRGDGLYRADGVADTLGTPAYVATPAAPEAMAREFIAARHAQLGLASSGTSTLARTSLREGNDFSVVRFEQHVNGLPVYGSDIAVSVRPDGRVIYVANAAVTGVAAIDTRGGIDGASALAAARRYLGVDALRLQETRRMVYADATGTHLVWRVMIVAENGLRGDWEVLVDARSGDVLRAEDKAAYDTGTATVWTPDPLSYARVAYGATGYVDGNNADTAQLTAALVPVQLEGITLSGGNYSLSGPYAVCQDFDTPHTAGECPSQASPDFSVTRHAVTFDATMGYYHITRYLKYVNETLGIPAMPVNHPGGVHYDPHGFSGDDNSQFSSAGENLTFGEGGVDDAQDADVIIHELGHGIHHFVTSGHLSQVEGLSEGVGDYNAGSYSRDFPDQWVPGEAAYDWVFSWDGHNPFWSGRVLNYQLTHTYAQSAGQEIHTAGQYWASCNLVARTAVGALAFDKAYFKGLSMTGASTNQKAAAQAVINAAAALGYSQAQLEAIGVAYNSGNTGGNTGCTYAVTVPTATTGPTVDVGPASLEASADAGTSTTAALTIGNTGSADLDWNIDTADAATCATPSTVAWIGFAPASGTVATGAADANVVVTFDATGLTTGTYSTNVCVHSNDAAHAVVAVPVTFTVTPGANDIIFADGFDGAVVACEPVQLLADPGFETTAGDGGANDFWDSVTTQGDSAFWSATGGAEHIRNGTFVVWLGGYFASTLDPETHDASQAVTIPAGAPRFLNYWRWIGREGNGANTVTFTVDGNVVHTEDLPTIGLDTDWTLRSVDLGAYADGASHTVKVTYQHSGGNTDWDYYLDDATIDCTQTPSSKPAQSRPLVVAGAGGKRHD